MNTDRSEQRYRTGVDSDLSDIPLKVVSDRVARKPLVLPKHFVTVNRPGLMLLRRFNRELHDLIVNTEVTQFSLQSARKTS